MVFAGGYIDKQAKAIYVWNGSVTIRPSVTLGVKEMELHTGMFFGSLGDSTELELTGTEERGI